MYPGQIDPPPNQIQLYRALLHQVILVCGRIQTYQGQMAPIEASGGQ